MRESSKISNRIGTATERGFLSSFFLRAIFISCLLSLVSCLSAQVSATFRGDSTKIEIGDHLDMKLVVTASPDMLIYFPKFSGDTIGKIDIVKKGKIDTAKLGDKIIYTQDVTISAYEEGRYFFNPSTIYYVNKTTGTIDSTYTNDWQFTVTAPAVDTTKPIKPIKAPIKVDYKWNEFTEYIAGFLGLIILLVIGYFLYKRYTNKPPPVVARPRPKEPAHIWAAKELRKLDQEKLWQNDKVKEYHSRLTDIIRLYLEFRFNYYAMEATTGEIMTEADKLDIGVDAGAKLREILSLADFVKFAKMTPAPDQNIKSIQDALAFVDMTKPVVIEETNINNKNK
jgi:hypothetical protein